MFILETNPQKETISVAIPLTSVTGKTRIKRRSLLNEYGIPVATRQESLSQDCYVEWQIGYDVPVKDIEKAELTTLKEKTFVGANGKTKYLYELSEYISYFYSWGIISKKEIEDVKSYLERFNKNYFLDVHPELSIKRSHLIEKDINDFKFFYTKVEYPLLIYKFDKYEIITEIVIKEKQRAVGTQPMLYFCFPLTELKESEKYLGRPAEAKELAVFEIDSQKKSLLLEMLKIFGTLSQSHCSDVMSIINLIIDEV